MRFGLESNVARMSALQSACVRALQQLTQSQLVKIHPQGLVLVGGSAWVRDLLEGLWQHFRAK